MNSGIYNYFLNGEPTGVTETFELKQLPDGSLITSAVRDAKPFNTTITVRTISDKNGFQICKIVYQKDENKVSANYEFSEMSAQILRKYNDEIVQNEKIKLAENQIFFPLMRCFQGKTILRVAENKSAASVLIPDIQATVKPKNLLKPTFDERTANLISTKDKLRIYNYLSKHYDDNSEFHIDENGLLVYYKFVQSKTQTWEVKLQF